MAQYLAITGSSFGNGHNDNPIYTITADVGTVYRSGSATGTIPQGGYAFTPATASKAELTAGINVKVDLAATEVTATVNGGYQCAGETAVQSWTIEASPTPTPTTTTTQTPTPSAQSRTLVLTDVEPDSTINGSGAGLSIGSTQTNYTQDDVNAGNQGLLGPLLISYNSGEQFTISTLNLNDGIGGSYTYNLSDYVGGAGYYLSVTGSFPDTAGGTTTTIDITLTGTAEATYEHEIHYNFNGISNATYDVDVIRPTEVSFSEASFTASYSGIEDAIYTASFVFTANNNYEFENANDITVSFSDGSPATNLSKIRQALSGANNEYVEIWYAGTIGANDAFAELDFSGTPVFASTITNADDVTVKYRTPGGTGTYYDLIISGAVQTPVTAINSANGSTMDLRIEGHDGRYEIVNNLSTAWISSISPSDNDTLDTITHTVTVGDNTGNPDRATTIRLQPQDGELGVKLNIPVSQSGTL